jgi:hypothetical protein
MVWVPPQARPSPTTGILGEQGDERGDAALVALEVPVNAWTRRSRLVVAG